MSAHRRFRCETASADDSQWIQERTHLLTISLGDATLAPLRSCHRLKHLRIIPHRILIGSREPLKAQTSRTGFRGEDKRQRPDEVVGRVLRDRKGG
jgi:hypothetical protein